MEETRPSGTHPDRGFCLGLVRLFQHGLGSGFAELPFAPPRVVRGGVRAPFWTPSDGGGGGLG